MSSTLSLNIQSANKPLRLLAAAATLTLAVMFPVGIIGMAGGMLTHERLWTTSVFLGVQAVLTFALLWMETSLTRATLITLTLASAAIAVEFVGLSTGWPFGTYYYSYYLEPFVVSNVPLAIVCAWYILVVNIVLLSRARRAGPAATLRKALWGGLMILAIDIMLEPFASFVSHYWTWSGGVIPLHNYAAWFAIGAALIGGTQYALPPRETAESAAGTRAPALILALTVLQCVIMNGLNGIWIPTAAGAALLTLAYRGIRHGEV